jgi:hypothetical protein
VHSISVPAERVVCAALDRAVRTLVNRRFSLRRGRRDAIQGAPRGKRREREQVHKWTRRVHLLSDTM